MERLPLVVAGEHARYVGSVATWLAEHGEGLVVVPVLGDLGHYTDTIEVRNGSRTVRVVVGPPPEGWQP